MYAFWVSQAALEKGITQMIVFGTGLMRAEVVVHRAEIKRNMVFLELMIHLEIGYGNAWIEDNELFF